MIDNGEAYIITLNTMQTVPTMAERFLWVWAKVSVQTVSAAMKMSSTSSHIDSLSFFFLPSEKTKKRIT